MPASRRLRARPWEYLLLRARAARLGRRRIRCWSCIRCGGSCSTAALRAELDRRRLERAAAARSDAAAAHALIAFVYAGHSDWDTPNYSAEAPCVQAACTDSAGVLTQPFPAQLRFAGAGATERAPASRRARQQQLGGGRACTRAPASR